MKKNISTFITIILTISALLGNIKTTEAIYEYVDSSGNRTKACGETQEDCMTKFKDACPDIATYNANQICTMNSVATTCENNSYNIICPGSDIIQTAAQTTTTDSIINDKYKLLAPIGNLTEAPDNVGDYFNVIFKIIIGLCAVLAVIMIVIGGIQYMGSESIFGKTEAKSRIAAAILGLIIALGAYALLNTINPDLLGGGGVTIKQVSAEIEDEQESVPWNEYTQGSSSNKNCPEGYGDVSTPWGDNQHKKINVCKTILSKTNEMVLAAKKDGLLLTGSGSRSYERQQKHWSDHNCKPPGSTNCSKIVAKPGTSMHESGYAIDFQCDNKPIAKVDPNNKCVVWLSKNAIKYGFKNLPSESWHWSAGPNAGH